MAKAMNAALATRIGPGLTKALPMAADREHRSIAKLAELLIRDYCGRNGTTIQVQQALHLVDDRPARAATE